MTLDEELWAAAFWVERTQGENAPSFISDQIGRCALAGNTRGLLLWREVARRFERLCTGEAPPNGN
jgi:hypothetical protein